MKAGDVGVGVEEVGMAEDGVEGTIMLRGDMVGVRVVGARFVGSCFGEADVAGFNVEKVTVSGDDAVRDRVVVGTLVGTDVEGAVVMGVGVYGAFVLVWQTIEAWEPGFLELALKGLVWRWWV